MKRIKWGVFAVAVVLAAMGCWFCWNCPMEWLYGEGQYSAFMRQVVWNAMGLVLFASAAIGAEDDGYDGGCVQGGRFGVWRGP